LLSATAGSALALTGALLAGPAGADPISPQCFQAQANVASQQNNVESFTGKLNNDNVLLQNAKDKLAKDQAAVPVNTDQVNADQTVVSNAQQTVNNDQASLRTAQANLAAAVATRDSVCNTVTPTTTPVPPPVGGVVIYPTCAAAFRAGVHDIARSDPRYRLVLDRDRDGIACEQNGDDTRPIVTQPPVTTVVTQPPATTIVTQPPVTNTIVAPAPVAPNTVVIVPPAPVQSFGQVGTAPSGAINTGDGSLATGD
jgi:hypothetical protein